MEKIYSVEQLPLQRFVNILDKNKYIIIFITAAITLLLFFFMPQPQLEYEAVSKILVKQKSVSVTTMFAEEQSNLLPLMKNQNAIKTYIELIKSIEVSRSVAKKLLADEIENSVATGVLSNEIQGKSYNDLSFYLLERIDADYAEDANVIRIHSRTENPDFSKKIANLTATVFINFNQNLERGEIRSALNYIVEQKGLAKKKLDQTEYELEEYLRIANPRVMSDGLKEIISRLAQLESRYNEIEINETLAKNNIKESKKLLNSKSAYSDKNNIQDLLPENIKELTGKLEDLKSEYNELSNYQKETHPEIKKLKSRIKIIEEKISSEIKNMSKTANKDDQLSFLYNKTSPYSIGENYMKNILDSEQNLKSFDKEKKEILKQKDMISVQLKTLPLDTLKHTRLVKNVETANNIYLRLMQREEELRLMEAKELGGLILYEKAEEAFITNPPKPRSTSLILDFILGLIISISVVLIKEYLDTTFKNPNDVFSILKLKILGIVPEIIPDKDSNYIDGLTNFAPYLITHFAPKSPSAEAFRALRIVLETNVELYNSPKQGKTLLISSPTPGEGKSICASNIALSFANINKKVIIVDTDTRKPSLNKLFNIHPNSGLTDVVFKNCKVENAIVRQVVPNLDILFSGERAGTEIEFTSSKKFIELMNILKQTYELIIFDSPAMLVVSDPVMLSTMMDSVVMVVRHNYTKYDAALQALRYFENVNAKLYGVIYNGVVSEKKYYYKYYEKQS
ncbi:polysaccharide biosynthesis tyrosine autokinase [Candidatus Dependentiae bacterium]|nr:polysaccharide biosynthesis tyrosine autokinase [Candidatus Dependentiae bacterium]